MTIVKSGFYDYKIGPNTLGIGVDNLAFADYKIAINEPIYGPRYNVKRSFAALDGAAQFPLAPSGPAIDLRANGVYMGGNLALGMLTQMLSNNSSTPGNG